MRTRDKHHDDGDSAAISCRAPSYVSLVRIGYINTRCNNYSQHNEIILITVK